MLTIVLIILLVVLLAGRGPAWNPADPIGLLISVLFIVLIVWLILSIAGDGGLLRLR